MPSFSPTLFWDCDPATLDVEEHAPFIISRVLTRGRLDDWKAIKRIYGVDRLRREVVSLRNLDARTLAFCSAYFGISKDEFRCHSNAPFSSPKPDHS